MEGLFMSLKHLAGASAATFLAFGSAAYAADVVVSEPAAPVAAAISVFSWAGGYIGIHGGYAWTDAEFSDGGAVVLSDDFNGGLVGAHAGYNWDFGNNFIGGVEVDIDHVWDKNDYTIFGTALEAGTDWQGSARLRAGYALDRTLLFATGGVAFANGFVEVPAAGFDESEKFVGWTAGAGVEHAFTDNWIGRVEYRYADFGSEEIADTGVDVDLKQHSVRLGISYKF